MKLNTIISKENWTEVLQSENIQLAANIFYTTFNKLLDQCRINHKKNTNKFYKIKPWITQGLIKSIKNRDKMKHQLLKNNSLELLMEYKTYRNRLSKLLKKSKHDYYRNNIKDNQSDMKKIYQIISDATNEKSKHSSESIQIMADNDIAFRDNKEMSNYCNNYFINVGINMLTNIKKPANFANNLRINKNSMFLTPVTDSELIKHISTLKNNGAPGKDGITAKIIKTIHMHILEPLKHIINLSFQTGIVPTQFKTSIVTPIHKSGDKSKIKNYRPISLINNFGKVFEKCLKERLLLFITANNILHNLQFGFQKGKSTSDAMYTVINEITKNLDTDKKCIAVFLDLAKAFDTVDHNKLLNILEQHGVRGTVLDVFSNYLTNRLQQVKINNTLSDQMSIKIGVPQGTVLGPVLFLLYINSMLSLLPNIKIISYADDSVILCNGSTWTETKNQAETGMSLIKNWLNAYQLSLNVEKTNYIAFSITNVNRPQFNTIQIDEDTIIREASEVKYLGIIIDQNLKWDNHIDNLTTKVRKLIHKFYQIREFLPKALLLLVYKTLVESLLRYGILVWGGLYANSLQKLNIVQKFIIKIIYMKKKRYPSRLLYSRDICNIRSLYFLNVCTYAFKNEQLLNLDTQKHSTRSATNKLLVIPKSHKNIRHRFLSRILPKTVNSLPINIRQIKNLKRFTIATKQFIFDHYCELIKILET